MLETLRYVPSDGVAPARLEPTLRLPPGATLQLSVAVEKAFLKYTAHPPDAQRGWDLPPAVLVPFEFGHQTNASAPVRSKRARRMYTPVLLVDLATPDFSMPYNVIIMSCTLIALIFGSVFNLLTRRFVVVRVDGRPPVDAPAPAQEARKEE